MQIATSPASLDLSLESLDDMEAPLSDMEWGILAGAGFGFGMWGGYVAAGALIVT